MVRLWSTDRWGWVSASLSSGTTFTTYHSECVMHLRHFQSMPVPPWIQVTSEHTPHRQPNGIKDEAGERELFSGDIPAKHHPET